MLPNDFTSRLVARRSGFGLLEVLLATAIFIVVVGSMVTLGRLSLRNATLSNHRTQAYNLAEDTLESIRQARDTNWLSGPASVDSSQRWAAFIHDCTSQDYASALDPVNQKKPFALCYDKTAQRFGAMPVVGNNAIVTDLQGTKPDPGAATFTRTVTFEPVGAGDLKLLNGNDQNQPNVDTSGIEKNHFIKVKATVTWKDFDRDWSVNLSTILTNWKAR